MKPTWGLPDALACWLAGFVGAIVAFAAGGAFGATLDSTAFIFMVAVPLQYAAILATVVLISRTKGTGSLRHDFGLGLRPRDVPLLGVGAGLQIALALLLTPIARLAHLSKEPQELVRRAEHGTGTWLLIVIIVATAVIAPVVEELVFRGVLLRALLRRTTSGWAIAGSAALFAAAHLTDPGAGFVLPALFGLGLVLGYLATSDGALSRPILVHSGFNLLATVLSLSHR